MIKDFLKSNALNFIVGYSTFGMMPSNLIYGNKLEEAGLLRSIPPKYDDDRWDWEDNHKPNDIRRLNLEENLLGKIELSLDSIQKIINNKKGLRRLNEITNSISSGAGLLVGNLTLICSTLGAIIYYSAQGTPLGEALHDSVSYDYYPIYSSLIATTNIMSYLYENWLRKKQDNKIKNSVKTRRLFLRRPDKLTM